MSNINYIEPAYYTIGNCQVTPYGYSVAPMPVPDKKENNMGYAAANVSLNADDPSKEARNHLRGRLADIYNKKLMDARDTFHLNDDKSPKTVGEVKERLAKGQFSLSGLGLNGEEPEDKVKIKDWYFNEYFRWRDPAVKADREGYEEYQKKLNMVYTKTLDQIVVKSPEEGLKALEEFEAYEVE